MLIKNNRQFAQEYQNINAKICSAINSELGDLISLCQYPQTMTMRDVRDLIDGPDGSFDNEWDFFSDYYNVEIYSKNADYKTPYYYAVMWTWDETDEINYLTLCKLRTDRSVENEIIGVYTSTLNFNIPTGDIDITFNDNDLKYIINDVKYVLSINESESNKPTKRINESAVTSKSNAINIDQCFVDMIEHININFVNKHGSFVAEGSVPVDTKFTDAAVITNIDEPGTPFFCDDDEIKKYIGVSLRSCKGSNTIGVTTDYSMSNTKAVKVNINVWNDEWDLIFTLNYISEDGIEYVADTMDYELHTMSTPIKWHVYAMFNGDSMYAM